MEGLKLKILDLGDMTFSRNELIATTDFSEKVVSPALAVLIDHPTAGYILFDTGNSPRWEQLYNKSMRDIYPISRLVTIEQALHSEGLTPANIRILALSHLHFDHAGGLSFFQHTQCGCNVYLSKKEWDAAVHDMNHPCSAYMRPLFYGISGLSYHTVEGNCDLAPGVTLFPQTCHTAGLMGLRVDLPHRGTVIFTSDSVYVEQSNTCSTPPGGSINKSQQEFFDNLTMLRSMRSHYHATFFYGHDIEQARSWQAEGWIE